MGDQKMIENAFYEKGLKSLRVTFLQIMQHGIVSEKGQLTVMGKDIAIVYYRTGYTDKQYQTTEGAWCEKKWLAREMLESSSAVKCPSIHG